MNQRHWILLAMAALPLLATHAATVNDATIALQVHEQRPWHLPAEIQRVAIADPSVTDIVMLKGQRDALLVLLEGLSAEQWLRGGTIYGAGNELERDVHFYAQWLARHERSHLKEIDRISIWARSRPANDPGA